MAALKGKAVEEQLVSVQERPSRLPGVDDMDTEHWYERHDLYSGYRDTTLSC